MSLSEQLLLRLSREPSEGAVDAAEPPVSEALDELRDHFPDFDDRIRGRSVVDFGCGSGRQAVAMALAGAARVLGLDIQPDALRDARTLARASGVSNRCVFASEPPPEFAAGADIVLSKDSMEHFRDPVGILGTMRSLLAGPEARVLITFCPTWYSPYGAHMNYFTPVPWVHLLFPEEAVMRVRARYRNDGAMRYEDVPGGLNRMSVAKFERTVQASGLRVEWRNYRAIKRLPFVSSIPGLRELLVTRVDCILAP